MVPELFYHYGKYGGTWAVHATRGSQKVIFISSKQVVFLSTTLLKGKCDNSIGINVCLFLLNVFWPHRSTT